MTRQLLVLLCLTSSLDSCRQKENTKYFWVNFKDKQFEKTDTNEIYKIDKTILPNETKISIFSRIDTLHYRLKTKNNENSFVSGIFSQNGNIRLLTDTLLTLDNELYHAKTYIFHEEITDGASIHYFEPSIGIYAIHSATWPALSYLQTTDSMANLKIKKLLRATIPVFFARGQFVKVLTE